MKLVEKLAAKAKDNRLEGVTVAFLGDSVTQGCFELYKKEDGVMETVFDPEGSYERAFREMLSVLYPSVPVTVIDAGISGDTAPGGLARIDRDVIRHQPDLCVVCYGLNDCGRGTEPYVSALTGIFEKLKDAGIETIFMTPNMMATRVSSRLDHPDFAAPAANLVAMQNDGTMDGYMDEARKAALTAGVTVCDVYAIWKRLASCGADTTELLANRLNHPTRKMNRVFAYELIRTILGE